MQPTVLSVAQIDDFCILVRFCNLHKLIEVPKS